MAEAPVLYADDGTIVTLTLNRPENRNSMTADVVGAFQDCVRRVRESREARVVIVAGSGTTFCGGADFRSLDRAGHPLDVRDRVYGTYEAFLPLLDVEVPIIAAMTGHAIGGGLGLALVCDVRVANREARYGANFSRLGIHSGMAISYLLPRIVGVANAADLLFSGRIVDGAEAERLRLVHVAVAADEVLGEARRRAEEIASAAPLAVRLMKKTLYAGLDWNPRRAAYVESWPQAATLTSEDAEEGIRALLEKRPPVFRGR
jgi:enoyl-CoA hydratase/carnithine racemase